MYIYVDTMDSFGNDLAPNAQYLGPIFKGKLSSFT